MHSQGPKPSHRGCHPSTHKMGVLCLASPSLQPYPEGPFHCLLWRLLTSLPSGVPLLLGYPSSPLSSRCSSCPPPLLDTLGALPTLLIPDPPFCPFGISVSLSH